SADMLGVPAVQGFLPHVQLSAPDGRVRRWVRQVAEALVWRNSHEAKIPVLQRERRVPSCVFPHGLVALTAQVFGAPTSTRARRPARRRRPGPKSVGGSTA